jgi:hypothetical protein
MLCLGCFHYRIFSLKVKESTGSRWAPETIDYRYEKLTAVTSSPLLLRCTSCVTGSGRRGSKPSLSSPSSPLLPSQLLLPSSSLLLSPLLDGEGVAESQTSWFCHSQQLTPSTASKWRRVESNTKSASNSRWQGAEIRTRSCRLRLEISQLSALREKPINLLFTFPVLITNGSSCRSRQAR